MAIVIDKTDGSLNFDGNTVGQLSSLHVLRNLKGGKFLLHQESKPYFSYKIALSRHFNVHVGIAVNLTETPAGTTILSYDLWIHDTDIPWGEYASWDTWSEAKELGNLEKLKGILRHSGLANPQEFTWGSVYAYYEQRSGGSSLVIRYSRT